MLKTIGVVVRCFQVLMAVFYTSRYYSKDQGNWERSDLSACLYYTVYLSVTIAAQTLLTCLFNNFVTARRTAAKFGTQTCKGKGRQFV